MTRLLKWLEEAMVAITFSEVGEYAVAKEFLAVPTVSTRTRTASEIYLPTRKPLRPEGNQ